MPEIKVQHIVSCSSEDKNHRSDNLLKPEGTHKWKCASPGEKNVSVILQFEKASQIQSIDIGNEGSAFVEVLVGKSAATSDQDYQVLLVASTFMTPLEARNGTNRNSVRMFGADKLSATAVKEKWDRVKVVCTQPFNKTSAFGLSFIKFHSTPTATNKDKEHPKSDEKKLGFFKLKNEENGDVKTGSLFAHRDKPTEAKSPVTGAAAIRAASRLAEESKPRPSSSTSDTSSSKSATSSSEAAKSTPGQKTEVKPEIKQKKLSDMKTEKEASPSPKQNREKRKHNVSDDDDDTEEEDSSKLPLRKQSTSLSSTASKGDKPPPMKKTKSEPPKESPVKEFSKLMEKVVFVLSGFQNPHRGELRDRALSMGAIYKPDWGKSCTHLICAFPNTPKYNQVSGKGKIVSQKWINDCYKQKKLLPWRKYRLGDADSPDEESDEDDYVVPAKTPKKEEKPPKKKPSPPPKEESDEDMYGGDTDSGEDTEDEVRRIKEGKAKKKTPTKKASPVKNPDPEDDPYGAETDEDEPGPSKGDKDDGNDSGLPELPDFFTDKRFFFYGEMSASDRRLLTRYITAYNGEIEDYMNEKVKYVVTSSKWDDNFDDALSDNPNLVFVKPKWIFMCHEKVKCLPHQPYIVVPDS